jgi:hypothetical protein
MFVCVYMCVYVYSTHVHTLTESVEMICAESREDHAQTFVQLIVAVSKQAAGTAGLQQALHSCVCVCA